LNPILKDQEWLSKLANDYHPWVANMARLRALARQTDKNELSGEDILQG
jgi:hypothetical protein